MIYQRLYLACADTRADAVEQAADATFGAGWLRMARGTFLRGVASWSVASFQATDAEATTIATMVEGRPGLVLLRGPDDDGPRAGDVLVDEGDGDGPPALTRYTWRRVVADLGLTIIGRTPHSSAAAAPKGRP